MKRNISVFALMVMAVLLTACVKNRFVVEFALDDNVSVNCRLVYYASSKNQGITIENYVPVNNGKASAECPTRFPAVVSLSVPGSSSSIFFWAERGDKIVVTGQGTDPLNWDVSGNDINRRWSKFRKENSKALASGNAEAINGSIAEYVNKNTDDPLSALLMLCSYDRNKNPEQWLTLWNKISDKCKKRELIQATGFSDLASMDEPTVSRKLKDMVVRSAGRGCDTLRFSKSKKGFIYLWMAGEDNRKNSVDSLRRLRQAYSDSSRYLIADLCMDTDSLMWQASVKSDSLKGVVRGWVPRGVADTDIMQLGIGTTPWYIVTESNRTVYSGNTLMDALKAFRK